RLQQPLGVLAELPGRRSVTDDIRAERAEDLEPLHQLLLFLLRGQADGRTVRVTVVGDLVTARDDLLHPLRMPFSHPAWDEEGRDYPVALQELEDQGDRDLRAVGSLGQNRRAIDVLGIVTD